MTLVCVVIAFPLLSFWAVWDRDRQARRRLIFASGLVDRGAGVNAKGAATVVINPMRAGAAFEGGPGREPTLPDTGTESLPQLLAPFLADYRAEAWYTRHADFALTLLLAALQVRQGRR